MSWSWSRSWNVRSSYHHRLKRHGDSQWHYCRHVSPSAEYGSSKVMRHYCSLLLNRNVPLTQACYFHIFGHNNCLLLDTTEYTWSIDECLLFTASTTQVKPVTIGPMRSTILVLFAWRKANVFYEVGYGLAYWRLNAWIAFSQPGPRRISEMCLK